ncbi:MAG: hypothetical protein BAA01_03990 [Bacillus thermozeamaize]|uniref:3-hydroxyacyl-CoA dehydrogenase NAD binding domain-containing protein n=1 Tax=Bacillus thermozeamaize TaxID=230954 RepID=A0A1Y3PHE7_9BACI|nr:MAG: hypothetical protein BAA01_03990 [Bacillus thermozeamaize]
MQRVFVVGAGLMGRGIAQVCAQAGFAVTLSDIHFEQLSEARSGIESGLNKLVAKGKMTAHEAQAAKERIRYVTDLEAAREAEYVIEAVTEKKEVKFALFQELDRIVSPGVTLATNTSSISITEIAAMDHRGNDSLRHGAGAT